MQYPIIDTIAQAYINNGWTGLDIVEGKNLLKYCSNETYTINSYYTDFAVANNRLSIFHITPLQKYTLSFDANTTVEPFNISVGCGDGRFLIDIITKTNNFNGRVYVSFLADNNHLRSGDILALRPIRYNQQTNYTFNIENVMLETGSEPTPYEPYGYAKNDFPNRLKLPLPHYFPHPVIDALQRAAACTQTADDIEVLRHYLTPLGIGGI